MRSLAAELRAGGVGTAMLAFALGALHALTPGHGKALAAYFLGQDARFAKGLRVALSAALLHVLSGFAVFFVLRLIVGQSPSLLGGDRRRSRLRSHYSCRAYDAGAEPENFCQYT